MRLGRRARDSSSEGKPRVLVPFTAGDLDLTVLRAALRIARAEEAVLVPAYLLVLPMELGPESPASEQVERAMPMLEAVEIAALEAGVPVDARIERGRAPLNALQKLWDVEHFDRIIVPAPVGDHPGFTNKELSWMLANAPSEMLILRPDPGSDDRSS